MKILLVEDDLSTRKLERIILERAAYDVFEAENGAVALEFLDTNIVDIVLLDVVMPEVPGLDVLRQMKKDPRTKKIPVILCTSISDQQQVREAMSLGVTGYILKPIAARDLLQKVRLASKKIDPVLEEPVRTIHKLGLDLQGYQQLLKLMIDDAKDRLKEIGKKVESGEYEQFESFARDVATTAENLGAPALMNTALDIKNSVSQIDPATRNKYLFKLRYEIERLQAAASKLLQDSRSHAYF